MIGSSRLVPTAVLLMSVALLSTGGGERAHAQVIPMPQPVPGLPGVNFILNDSPQNFLLAFRGGAVGGAPAFVEFNPASPNWHFEFDLGLDPIGRVAIFGTIFHELHPPGEGLDLTDGDTVTPSIVIQPGLGLPPQILAFSRLVDHPTAGGLHHSDFYTASGRCVGAGCGLGNVPGWSATFSGQHRSRPVPEPGSLALLGFGLLGLIGIGCRQRLRRQPSGDRTDP